MCFQEAETGSVVLVVGVDVSVERAGIDDQRDNGTSLASISSMRSDTSRQPLRPAAAAPNRRTGPLRWVSMASLVSSEMVISRCSASWRSLASSSSGSVIVVRIMHASIPAGTNRPDKERIHRFLYVRSSRLAMRSTTSRRWSSRTRPCKPWRGTHQRSSTRPSRRRGPGWACTPGEPQVLQNRRSRP